MAYADRLARLLPYALLLWLAAAFALPTEAAYALVFYCLMPVCLFGWLIGGRWRGARDQVVIAGVALIGWSALTLLWGRNDLARAPRFLAGAAMTLVFFLAASEVFRDPAWRRRARLLLVSVATVSAVFCISRFFLFPPATLPIDTPRLRGWGMTAHPVLGASVTAVALLTSLSLATARQEKRALYLAAAGVMAVEMLLMKSRGALFGAGAGGLFLLLAAGWWRTAWAVLAAAAGAWLVAPVSLRAGLIRAWEPGRFGIWQRSLGEISERPLFGHGLAANLRPVAGADATFPHDLYLSLLFYSGVVGLAVFAVLIVACGRRIWSAGGDEQAVWVAALGLNALAAGLTDFGQITKGPGPLWLIFWLPVGLAAGLLQAPGRQGIPNDAHYTGRSG